MRILEVSRAIPAHRHGGLEWHTLDLVESLAEAGASVQLLTTPLPRVPLGPAPAVPTHTVGAREGGYGWKYFAALLGEVRRLHRRHRYDLIHAQGYAGVFLARHGGRSLPPVVTTIHGTLWSETALRSPLQQNRPAPPAPVLWWRYKHRHAFSPLWRRFLRGAPHLITDSQFTVGELTLEAGHQVHAKVIPLGVDLERYPLRSREEAREFLQMSGEGRMFLLAGRLEPLKRHRRGLEALWHARESLSPDDRIVIAGAGSERAGLERFVEGCGLAPRVRFLGAAPSEQMAAAFAAADLFLQPDRGAPAFGLVTAEALLQGSRVLATDSGATGEVIADEQDGTLIAVLPRKRELSAWRKALSSIAAALPESAESRRARATWARERFDRRRMARDVLAEFTRILSQR